MFKFLDFDNLILAWDDSVSYRVFFSPYISWEKKDNKALIAKTCDRINRKIIEVFPDKHFWSQLVKKVKKEGNLCPRCGSPHQTKAGYVQGKPRTKCKICNFKHI